jgi:hypothetical protein
MSAPAATLIPDRTSPGLQSMRNAPETTGVIFSGPVPAAMPAAEDLTSII